ncbi:MAG: hypothetical protein ACJAZO_005047 [Myxococcota bacterium]|jgi:hypothetical protein
MEDGMRLSVGWVLLGFACSDGSDSGRSVEPGADVSAFDWTLDAATLNADVTADGLNTAFHTQDIIYTYLGRWWNSEGCPDCVGVVLTLVDDTLNSCAEIESAGPFPGSGYSVEESGAVVDEPGDYELSVVLLEDVTCESVQQETSSIASAKRSTYATLRVQLDETMTSVGSVPVDGAVGVAQDALLVVDMAQNIDVVASEAARVELWRGDERVPATVLFDRRFVVLTSDIPLSEGRVVYTIEVDGLVGQTGAFMPELVTVEFSTVLFDDQGVYAVFPVATPDQRLALGPGSDGEDVVHLEPESPGSMTQEWRFELVNGGFRIRNQSVLADLALGAESLTAVPALGSVDATSAVQSWQFTGDSVLGYELSVVAFGAENILYPAVSPDKPALGPAGSTAASRWQIIRVGTR